MLDQTSQTVTFKAFPDQSPAKPFEKDYPFAVLVEIEAFDDNDNASDRLFTFIEECGDYIEDGVVAQD